MAKAFASAADVEEKTATLEELVPGLAYAYTAEGDPNAGVVIGEEGVLVIDPQATPIMAEDVLAKIRTVTDKPVTHILLTHYHAVRVFGAHAYGAREIMASADTRDLIVERGEQDKASEIGRFPRLFRGLDSVPEGLIWPTITFEGSMTLWFGELEIQIRQMGRGHTKGDTVVWLPEHRVLFSGDLVEYGATPYTGDAYLRDWPVTLERLRQLDPAMIVPGRGAALRTPPTVKEGLDGTRDFLITLFSSVKAGVDADKPLRTIYHDTVSAMRPRFGDWVIFDHCMPFDVTRAYDEARGHRDPQIWTAERDRDMWEALEG
jgi:glyoxylase-like metal-dependent hydrolase (beta-lactamase superfamily II)